MSNQINVNDPKMFLNYHLDCARREMTFDEMAMSLGMDTKEYIDAVQESIWSIVKEKKEGSK